MVCEPIKTGKTVTAIRCGYVFEKVDNFSKPIRPRLAKCPRVKKDSHDYGEWMRKNCILLKTYEQELKAYDSKQRLTMPDLRKAVQYSKFCDRDWCVEKTRELGERAKK